MPSFPRAFLKPRRVRPFVYRHPWVFGGAIDRWDGQPEDGGVVDLHDPAGTFIARGLFNSRSQITLRLYTWNPEEALDADFFARRIRRAVEYRSELRQSGLLGGEDACRLINSEGDGLTGLVLDSYPPYGVVQFLALGLDSRREQIVPLLAEITGLSHLYERSDGPICRYEGLPGRNGVLIGQSPPPLHPFRENGLSFVADLKKGHKTGTYLDQRENRARAAQLARGGRILDVFSFTGSFGIHAAGKGGRVLAIDESERALELAKENARLNGLSEESMEVRKGRATLEMQKLLEAGERFNTVILDPPKFAHSEQQLERAAQGYHEINRLGLQLVESQGLFITCSCSGAVSAEFFQAILHEAAYQASRELQILEIRSQALDHPVALACPESRYLKCFIARVH